MYGATPTAGFRPLRRITKMGYTARQSSKRKLDTFRRHVVAYAAGERQRPPRLKYTYPSWAQFCMTEGVNPEEVFVDADHHNTAANFARVNGTSVDEEMHRLYTNHCNKYQMRSYRRGSKGMVHESPQERRAPMEEEEQEIEQRRKPIAELTNTEIGAKIVKGEWTRVQGYEYVEECEMRGEIILANPEEKEAELARRKFLAEPKLPYDQDSVKAGEHTQKVDAHLKRMLAEREQHK